MNRGIKRFSWAACIALITSCGLAACHVDEYANPWRKSSNECKKSGGRSIGSDGKFCVPDAGPATPMMDAAVNDGSLGMVDASDAFVPQEACTNEGASERCYTGADAGSSIFGECRQGGRTCTGGFWSECEGEVTPQPETCDGLDNDCDGSIDDGLDGEPCTIDAEDILGVCAQGITYCQDGKPICWQVTRPSSEICNGADDDCDGEPDENTSEPCYDATAIGCTLNADGAYECAGNCSAGTRACVDGVYAETCDGVQLPVDDVCTELGEPAIDEDCDEKTDEGCECRDGTVCYSAPRSTQSNAPCHAGVLDCGGAGPTCEDEVIPREESCENMGVDDDCDGRLDDVPMTGKSCAGSSDAVGACKASAVWDCEDGKQICRSGTPAADELCDGENVDEDCNGRSEEGFDLLTDKNNCGVCGMRCGASETCCAGSCVNITTSNTNCGVCGTVCGGATDTCCNGRCTSLLFDDNNCGACGRGCTVLGLVGRCTNGGCQL
ncbi:MAG: MopE-related protein [Polyangiales bacterium]